MIFPNFRGKHNYLKARVWLFLNQERQSGKWFSSLEIHEATGCNLKSLQTALIKWRDWKRISRRKRESSSDLCLYEYRITAKGAKWVKKWRPFMPVQRYKTEIKSCQGMHGTGY